MILKKRHGSIVTGIILPTSKRPSRITRINGFTGRFSYIRIVPHGNLLLNPFIRVIPLGLFEVE